MPAFPPDTRVYSPSEERELAERLQEISRRVHAGELADRLLDTALLCDLHRALFRGVRGHAGRPRGPGVGQEYLNFGPNRSVHRDDVDARLQEAFRQAQLTLLHLNHNRDDPDYELRAIRMAVEVHATIIRVHPFEDGNGRSSRLVLDWVLLRLGLRSAPPEFPKEEYRACLNHYFETRDLDPLVDLYVRVLADNLPSADEASAERESKNE